MEKITSRTNWINILDLQGLIKYFVQNNKSMYLPYHNYSHTLGFLYHALAAGMREFGTDKKKLQELGVAVIFHDFNHSGGKYEDEVNIRFALDALRNCPKEYFPPGYENFSVVEDLIKSTQYPYIINDEDLSQQQKIMRDCDILWIIDSSSLIQNILGLGTEMSFEGEIHELIDNHKKFVIESAKTFRTGYAMDIFDSLKSSWEFRLNQFINNIK